MERVLRLSRFWQWIPYFRVVAETEHLPTASEMLHVSPSALSRSVRLLEREVGVSLFTKDGRRLKLTDQGAELLQAVRIAMRVTDDGLDRVRSEVLTGRVSVSSVGVISTAFVAPSLVSLRRLHDELEPRLCLCPGPQVVTKLLRGELDVAFVSLPVQHPELDVKHLAALRNGVYCGHDHALFGRESVTLDDVVAHDFVTALPDASGIVRDGWPPAYERRIVLHVDQINFGLRACATAGLLAVLPDAIVAAEGDGLWRVPLDGLGVTDVWAVRRRDAGKTQRASDVVVDAVHAALVASPHVVVDAAAS